MKNIVNKQRHDKIYSSLPHITWAVDCNRVILFNNENHEMLVLNYPEAAIWDLLTQNYPLERICHMLCNIMEVDPGESKNLILQTLENLTNKGFLAR